MNHRYDRRPLLGRWAEKVLIGDGCWEWAAAKFRRGYGCIWEGGAYGRTLSAHRVAYRLFVGEIPDGMCVLHKCDNRGCVKPSHLFLGNQTDNMRDMSAKGRGGRSRGEVNGVSRLTRGDVADIRRRLKLGETQKSVAAAYGVAKNTISSVHLRRNWRWLEETT